MAHSLPMAKMQKHLPRYIVANIISIYQPRLISSSPLYITILTTLASLVTSLPFLGVKVSKPSFRSAPTSSLISRLKSL